MELNVQKLLKNPGVPYDAQAEYSFAGRAFEGYTPLRPVRVQAFAKAVGDVVYLDLAIDALVGAECARCLKPVASEERIEKQYRLTTEELGGEYPEIPVLPNGVIDLEELVYGELLIEVPGVLLCREDCEGLCARCGKPAGECTCEPEPQGDERLQVLRQLLTEDEID